MNTEKITLNKELEWWYLRSVDWEHNNDDTCPYIGCVNSGGFASFDFKYYSNLIVPVCMI